MTTPIQKKPPFIIEAVTAEQFKKLLRNDLTDFDLSLPADYYDVTTFLVDALNRGTETVRRMFAGYAAAELGLALSAAREVRLEWHLHQLLRVLAACQGADEMVAGLVAKPLAEGTYRERPSKRHDIHRELLLALTRHVPSAGLPAGLAGTVRRELGGPTYAAAAYAVLIEADRSTIFQLFPSVLALLAKHNIPAHMVVLTTARCLGEGKKAWGKLARKLGRTAAEETAVRLLIKWLARRGLSEVREVFLASRHQPSDSGESARPVRRKLVGVVRGDKMDKTRRVEVSCLVKHQRYGKYVRKRTVCYTHDEHNESRAGDTVEIMESRPLSKTKRWRLIRVVAHAPTQGSGIALGENSMDDELGVILTPDGLRTPARTSGVTDTSLANVLSLS